MVAIVQRIFFFLSVSLSSGGQWGEIRDWMPTWPVSMREHEWVPPSGFAVQWTQRLSQRSWRASLWWVCALCSCNQRRMTWKFQSNILSPVNYREQNVPWYLKQRITTLSHFCSSPIPCQSCFLLNLGPRSQYSIRKALVAKCNLWSACTQNMWQYVCKISCWFNSSYSCLEAQSDTQSQLIRGSEKDFHQVESLTGQLRSASLQIERYLVACVNGKWWSDNSKRWKYSIWLIDLHYHIVSKSFFHLGPLNRPTFHKNLQVHESHEVIWMELL